MAEKTFDEQVDELVSFIPDDVDYLVFKKIQNPITPKFPRNVPEEVPLLFKLDSAAATVDQVAIYERKGWPIVKVNIDEARARKGSDERVMKILEHIKARMAYASAAPIEVLGVKAKLAKKQSQVGA